MCTICFKVMTSSTSCHFQHLCIPHSLLNWAFLWEGQTRKLRICRTFVPIHFQLWTMIIWPHSRWATWWRGATPTSTCGRLSKSLGSVRATPNLSNLWNSATSSRMPQLVMIICRPLTPAKTSMAAIFSLWCATSVFCQKSTDCKLHSLKIAITSPWASFQCLCTMRCSTMDIFAAIQAALNICTNLG